MTGDQHEPNRVLGFPVGPRKPRPPRPRRENARQAPGPARPDRPQPGEEPQRVLGFPVDLFERVNLGRLRALARAVSGRRR